MSRKQFTTEKIIGMLREADVALAQGGKVGEICRNLGVSEQIQRQLPNRELFLTLEGGQGLYRNWGQEYNSPPHSSLNNRPPAPEAILPMGLQQPWVTRYSPGGGAEL